MVWCVLNGVIVINGKRGTIYTKVFLISSYLAIWSTLLLCYWHRDKDIYKEKPKKQKKKQNKKKKKDKEKKKTQEEVEEGTEEEKVDKEEESEKESSEDKSDQDSDEMDNLAHFNPTPYFPFICCPSVCANAFTKCLHRLIFLFILVSIGVSVTNYVIGPNVGLYKENIDDGEVVKLEQQHLLNTYNIFM